MGRFFTLTKTKKISAEPRKRRRFRLSFSGGNRFGYVLAVLLAVISFGYFMQANSMATMGYEIDELEKNLDRLQESNKRLEIEAAEMKSIEAIEEEVKLLNLVPSGEIKYVKDSSLTLRD